MVAIELQSGPMAKKQEAEKLSRPDDVVRFVTLMTREQRARLKFFCERVGRDMERVGTEWLMDRLAQEESKLAKPRR